MSEMKALWIGLVRPSLVGNKAGLLTSLWVVQLYPELYVSLFTLWVCFLVVSWVWYLVFNLCKALARCLSWVRD